MSPVKKSEASSAEETSKKSRAAGTKTTKKPAKKTASKRAASSSSDKPKKTDSRAKKSSGSAARTAAGTGAKTSSRSRKTVDAKGRTLIIVESPEKAQTINGMLGSNYIVRSSKGHIRDLPRSRMAIDIENNFAPEYILVKGKAALKNELTSLAQTASNVLLASDPDREGEAIAWHLAEILGVDMGQKCRVRFYEITANAVREAVSKPDLINMDLVDAQQARRILDRLVGYTLSPLLWKKIHNGLSAGRVQSVALTLICAREDEIAKFVPDEYWAVTVTASSESGGIYELRAERMDGVSLMKGSISLGIKDESMADEIIREARENPLTVTEFTTRRGKRAAPAPFRTSTMQQDASHKLGMTPSRTMRVAQSLYEGVNIVGRGHTGMITYMRTDSLRLSDEAVSACRNFIAKTYGSDRLPAKPNTYAAPGRSQDAHEAIRPTDVTLTPASVKDMLTPEQFRLYDMIWRRFVACQMEPAVVAKATIRAQAGRAGFRQEGETLVFDGWSAVWPLDLSGDRLETAAEGDTLKTGEIKKDQRFTRPPARYSEATLIKALEENGVGRPSTYATIVGTLDDRGYVVKNDERRLQATPLGMTVDGFLKRYFNRNDLSSIVDAGFTAQMEKELDDVEEARRKWLDVVGGFWEEFSRTLEEAESAEKVPMPEPEPIGEDCPECGNPLVKKHGRFGEFIACTGYPKCRYTRAILTTLGVKCPQCGEEHGGEIVKRRSRKGRTFYGCSRYPDCDYVSWDQPTGDKCPECGEPMFRRGKTNFCRKCGCKMQESSD